MLPNKIENITSREGTSTQWAALRLGKRDLPLGVDCHCVALRALAPPVAWPRSKAGPHFALAALWCGRTLAYSLFSLKLMVEGAPNCRKHSATASFFEVFPGGHLFCLKTSSLRKFMPQLRDPLEKEFQWCQMQHIR